MRTSITTELTSRTPIRLPAEVEYDLNLEDYVQCWRFLASKSRHHLSERVSMVLKWGVFWFHFVISFALVFLAYGSVAYYMKAGPDGMATALIMSAVLCLVSGATLADRHPELYLDGYLAKPCGWVCLLCLRSLARAHAKKGRTDLLDVLSHYRFAMSPEGLALTVEYPQMFGGSPEILRKRKDEIAWKAVEVVGNTERHVFFVIPDLMAMIVPRTCFADDSSLHEFAQTAIRYHALRLKVPGSQAVMPGRDDRFGPRPI